MDVQVNTITYLVELSHLVIGKMARYQHSSVSIYYVTDFIVTDTEHQQ